jgi:hypothetical protein
MKEKTALKRPDYFFKRLTALLFFLGFTNLFFFHPVGPTALALINIGFFTFLVLAFLNKKNYRKKLALITTAFLFNLFTSLVLILRDNSFIKIVLQLNNLILFLITIYIFLIQTPFIRSLMELCLAPFKTGLSFLKSGFKVLKLTFSPKMQQKFFAGKLKKSSGKSIFTGLVIAIPVTGLLIYFLSADPIFSHFLTKKAGNQFIKQMPARLILTLMLFLALSPLLLLKIKNKFYSPLRVLNKFSFLKEMAVVMFSVASIIAVFLIVQWPYIFLNIPLETDLSKFGINTYSEYVQQGFGQLTQAALFIFSLLWAGLITLKNNLQKSKAKKILTILQFVVLAEFMVFIISLFRRIWLYQQTHGWSLARIYGGFLLIWILGITITLALRHFWTKKWVTVEAVFSLIILICLGSFNAENFIIKSSHLPTINKQVDYVYLSKMSADGYQAWEMSLKYAEDVLEKQNLLEKETLNKEERRQIYYSGQIVYELAKNYHNLVKYYGSTQEYKAYYQKTLTFLKNYNQEKLKNLKQAFDPENKNKYEIERLENQLQNFQKELEKLEKDEANWEDIKPVYLTTHFNFQTFSYCETSWHHLSSHTGKEAHNNLTTINRFYMWNKQQNKAWEKIKQDQTLEKLLKLQEIYLKLHCKINSQPADQQDFDKDFSFNNPLL